MNIIKKIAKKGGQYLKPWSSNYWDNRYEGGGNSGAGSYGKLALFKNKIISDFCYENKVSDLLEFGSGDGNQASLLPAEFRYTGLDISPKAISLCRKTFEGDKNKKFIVFSGKRGFCKKNQLFADLTLSLDVIYHLIEDEVFENYMHELFTASQRFVIIYSSNKTDDSGVRHVKHRKFTDYVERNFSYAMLMEKIDNDFSPEKQLEEASFADFYIYKIER